MGENDVRGRRRERERRTVKGNTSEDEADDHAWGGPDHDFAAADDVDVLQRKEGENEVRARHYEAHSSGLVEADLLEQRRCGTFLLDLRSHDRKDTYEPL